MEQIRSFIAIELPNELKQQLTQLQTHLKMNTQSQVKWVDPYSIHLTLKFLGNITISVINDITKVMEKAIVGIPPFYLEVKDLGVFPNYKRAQIAWIGIAGDLDKLNYIQKQIVSNLIPLGFVTEQRPFTPHLTLARMRNHISSNERQSFGQLIASTKYQLDFIIKVNTINLMKSQLTRTGAIYSLISSASLNENHITKGK
ncbi:MAG: RNA 2',3'-cyclic phosphodiesterase [Dehalococcoidales bacterium]|nr:RNA 2',3'-cyclic phosphodiesterase [Dehalococcoidales bacterium]